jgi:hypothetical protein
MGSAPMPPSTETWSQAWCADRDQRHAEVGEAAQRAVQSGLVDHAVEDGAAVGGAGEREAVEARGPAVGQVSLDADPVVLAHRARLLGKARK